MPLAHFVTLSQYGIAIEKIVVSFLNLVIKQTFANLRKPNTNANPNPVPNTRTRTSSFRGPFEALTGSEDGPNDKPKLWLDCRIELYLKWMGQELYIL